MEKTKETYGAGLLVYYVYCDLNSISKLLKCPITQLLLTAFLSSCARAYSGSTLSNFIVGIQAWHILHGQPWFINHDETHSLLKGTFRLTPTSTKQSKCLPCDQPTLLSFITYMDLSSPYDAAIFCLHGHHFLLRFTPQQIHHSSLEEIQSKLTHHTSTHHVCVTIHLGPPFLSSFLEYSFVSLTLRRVTFPCSISRLRCDPYSSTTFHNLPSASLIS